MIPLDYFKLQSKEAFIRILKGIYEEQEPFRAKEIAYQVTDTLIQKEAK